MALMTGHGKRPMALQVAAINKWNAVAHGFSPSSFVNCWN